MNSFDDPRLRQCQQSDKSVELDTSKMRGNYLDVPSGTAVENQDRNFDENLSSHEILSSSSCEDVAQSAEAHEVLPGLMSQPTKDSGARHRNSLPKTPVIVEIFCGSARVTASLRTLGLSSSFGVDHIKVNPQGAIKTVDLTTTKGQKILMKWLSSPLVCGVFLAPPCGTCSLARNIKLRDSKGRVLPGPVPLRSQYFPKGLPGLSKTNFIRVSKANKLYEFVGRILRFAHARNMIIVVENPRSSLFWMTRWWKRRGIPTIYTAHQACAYGSQRPKWTVLAPNCDSFRRICKTCPGESPTHQHLPWGVLLLRRWQQRLQLVLRWK